MPTVKRTHTPVSGAKKKRCGNTNQVCKVPFCGECPPCKDKILFGGPNKMKKACIRQLPSRSPEKSNHANKQLHKPVTVVVKPKHVKENNKVDTVKTVVPGDTKSPVRKMNEVGDHGILKLNLETSKALQRKNEIQKEWGKPASPSSPSKSVEAFPFVNMQKMTKNDLTTFMRKLLKSLALKGTISLREKPDWWPRHVEWGVSAYLDTEEIRDVIKQCYKAYGKENMIAVSSPAIYRSPITRIPISATACKMVTMNTPQPDVLPPSPVKSRGFPKELFLPFSVEIYLCYFCEKEFTNKDKMRRHQKCCAERPPELIHSSFTSSKPVVDSTTSPPQISPNSSNLKLTISASNTEQVPQKTFAGYLGLVPSQTASRIRAKRKCSEISQEILEEIEPMSPPVITTPRTPKSLMSQWSREEAGGIAKKRLSYSLSMDKTEDKELVNKKAVDLSDSEEEVEANTPKATNLLNIPLTSLLGQKIQKYVQIDNITPILSDSELFCKTPTKNNFLEKLRKKPPSYPIIYKPRRIANLDKQNHLYKFNKEQTKEFLGKLRTGLNLASQEKLKLVKKLRIRVARLSDKQILKWMSRTELNRQLYRKFRKIKSSYRAAPKPDEFPAGPTLLSKNIDKLLGLKRRSCTENPSRLLSIYVSEEIEAKISKLQLALYKSLLYEMSILKPTVVVTDVQPKKDEGSVKHVDKSVTRLEKEEANNNSKKEIACDSGNTSTPKYNSVLRSMLLDRTVLEKKADLEGKSYTPKQIHKLRDLLQKEKGKITNVQGKQSQSGSSKKTNLCTVPVKNPQTGKPKMTERNGVMGSPSPPKKMTNNSMCSPGGHSHCDEPLSVISLSSEGESFSSDCCLNCKVGRQQRSQAKVRQPENCCLNRSGEMGLKPNFLEPLTVNVVENDLLMQSSKLHMVEGIPSPISAASGSPQVMTPQSTPSKSSPVGEDVLQKPCIYSLSQAVDARFMNNKGDASPDNSDKQRRRTRSLASVQKTSQSETRQVDRLSFSRLSPKANSNANAKPCSDKTAGKAPGRVKSLQRSIRSQSLTPSNTPQKGDLKTTRSLPCTPEKGIAVNNSLKNSLRSSRGRVLRNSNSKLKPRPSSPGSMAENPYSLKSGNFVVSTPVKLSPQKLVSSSALIKTNLKFTGSPTTSPTTRSAKRTRSIDNGGEPRSKYMKYI